MYNIYADLTLAAVSLRSASFPFLAGPWAPSQELELAAYAQRESFNNVSRLSRWRHSLYEDTHSFWYNQPNQPIRPKVLVA